MIEVAAIARAVQYTGINPTDVRDFFNASTFRTGHTHTVGSSDGTMVAISVFDSTNTQIGTYTVQTGNWCVSHAGTVTDLDVTTAHKDQSVRSLQDMATVMGSSGGMGAFGSYPNIVVPGVGNANFDVTIRPAMPNTAYTAIPVLTGSASLLGSLSITNVTNGVLNGAGKISGSVCRVNVANSGLVQLSGAAILVHVTP